MWPMRKKWWLYLIIKHCSKSDLRDISHCNQRLKAHQHTNVTSHHTCYVCALIAVTVQPVPRLAHTSVGCHQQNCHHQCQRNDILCAYLHKVLALLRFFFFLFLLVRPTSRTSYHVYTVMLLARCFFTTVLLCNFIHWLRNFYSIILRIPIVVRKCTHTHT